MRSFGVHDVTKLLDIFSCISLDFKKLILFEREWNFESLNKY